MKSECQTIRAQLPEYVSGQANPEVANHLTGCRECQREQVWLASLAAAALTPMWSAPANTQARAASVLNPTPRRTASLVSSSLSRLVFRGAAEEIHMLFEAEGVAVRLLLIPESESWRVVGRADSESVSIVRDLEILTADTLGRFEFVANTLAETGFTVVTGGTWVEVPTVEQVLDDDTR